VPDAFLPELLRVVEKRAVMRPIVRTVAMDSKTTDIRSLVSGIQVYWRGDNQTITQGDPVFGEREMDLHWKELREKYTVEEIRERIRNREPL
jgi:HK97 family phage major capsid protein